MNSLQESSENTYQFTSKKDFEKLENFKKKSIESTFNFAYDMSFGGKGKHRDHRNGGNHKRKNGEIFINTFQGKLAEFGIYNEFYTRDFQIPYPDLETYDLGTWDKYDFEVNNKKIAVKSTKPFGQLLLLETKDWTKDGRYIPNIGTENDTYNYFILVRIKATAINNKENEKNIEKDKDTEKNKNINNAESLMKDNKLFYSDKVDKDQLKKLIFSFDWSYDIPGFITHKELVYAIENKFILPQGSTLGKSTIMDAENYYIQTGDMNDIDELFKLL